MRHHLIFNLRLSCSTHIPVLHTDKDTADENSIVLVTQLSQPTMTKLQRLQNGCCFVLALHQQY